MPKSINTYTPDTGELEFDVSAADVTALAALTTAEAITLDGALLTFEETAPAARPYTETFVTGANTPINTFSNKQTSSTWQVKLVDDYSLGLAGEWGTDLLSAVELFQLFFDARRTITTLKLTPAGGSTGAMQTTLTNVDIQSMPHAKTDASMNAPNEIVITLLVESYAKAAHA